jgi:hypothetical protein
MKIIEQKIESFIKEIKKPTDFLKKIQELPTIFENKFSKKCVDDPKCYHFLDTFKKTNYGTIAKKEWDKIVQKTKKKDDPKKSDEPSSQLEYLDKCDQEFKLKKQFCPKETSKDSTPKDVIITPEKSKEILKSLKQLESKFDGVSASKNDLFSDPEQKKEIINKIQTELKSFGVSLVNLKFSQNIKNKLGQLNPLAIFTNMFKEIQDVIDGFQDSRRSTNNNSSSATTTLKNNSPNSSNSNFKVNGDFIINDKQRLSICQCLKKDGVRVDHGLLNYINTNNGDIKGIIRDISYDFKVGQIKFDEDNIYWIPLELGSINNVKSGGSKKEFPHKLKKSSKKIFKKISLSDQILLIGGNMYMWQLLLPVFDPNAPCKIPPDTSSGPGAEALPPEPLAGGANPKKNGLYDNMADNYMLMNEVGESIGKI